MTASGRQVTTTSARLPFLRRDPTPVPAAGSFGSVSSVGPVSAVTAAVPVPPPSAAVPVPPPSTGTPVSARPSSRRWTHQASRTAREKSTRSRFRLSRRSLLIPGMRYRTWPKGVWPTEGAQEPDPGDDVPDPPVAGLGPGPEAPDEEGTGGDQGQDAHVAGHLLEVVGTGIGAGLAPVGAQDERGGQQCHQPDGQRAAGEECVGGLGPLGLGQEFEAGQPLGRRRAPAPRPARRPCGSTEAASGRRLARSR